MSVSLERIDKTRARLTAKIEKADYAPRIARKLKEIQQKATMPGFRPGKVPASLIAQRFGADVKAEEVYGVLDEAVKAYLKANPVEMLGEIQPSNKQPKQDIAAGDDFEFLFDIALAPEISVELTGKDKLTYYDIEVGDEPVNAQVTNYAARAGSHEKVDVYQDGDMLKGTLTELDDKGNPKEEGIVKETVSLMPKYFVGDAQKSLFEGSKAGNIVTFSPAKAYEGREHEIASLLGVKKEETAAYTGDFSYQISEVSRFKPAALNQELFDQVFGKGAVDSEEAFRAKVKEGLEQQYVADSDYKLLLDARAYLEKKVGKLEFADDLLKKTIEQNQKDGAGEVTPEAYARDVKELSWHLIKEKLVAAFDIKIVEDDLKATAIEATRFQFAQYGMANVPDDLVESYAKEMLSKKEQVNGLMQRAIDARLTAVIKATAKLTHKKISVEAFNKLFENLSA